MSRFMMRGGIFALLMVSACVSLSTDEIPVRTQQNFLRDIRNVVDGNDLTDVAVVGKKLHIDFVVKEEGGIHKGDSPVILGYRKELNVGHQSREYGAATGSGYVIFFPSDGAPTRALISLSLNENVLCVTRADLFDVFGVVNGFKLIDGGEEYVYPPGDNLIVRAYFRFLYNGCLYRIGLNQGIVRG
ncbi:hypothetical protein [Burkholderia stagnalis]|uniref:hypothetical protein n=1 Tax=Burkholderia stagnalis TaxID=1503054 RepID=UPI0012D926BD|nr:hypothetical protein [Burkholderia stagnalis]